VLCSIDIIIITEQPFLFAFLLRYKSLVKKYAKKNSATITGVEQSIKQLLPTCMLDTPQIQRALVEYLLAKLATTKVIKTVAPAVTDLP